MEERHSGILNARHKGWEGERKKNVYRRKEIKEKGKQKWRKKI
jgi:hypothetical protein